MQPNPKPKAAPLLLLGIVGAVAVIATVAFLGFINRPAPVASGELQLVRPDSPSYGNPNAKVTLVEFLDPECEACASIHPLVSELKNKYRERVLFVARYLPLHANSVLAASAMEAAGEQGKYWEFAEIMYRGQPDWAPPHDGSSSKIAPREAFIQYAGFLGLDKAAFERSMDDPKHARKVERPPGRAKSRGHRHPYLLPERAKARSEGSGRPRAGHRESPVRESVSQH